MPNDCQTNLRESLLREPLLHFLLLGLALFLTYSLLNPTAADDPSQITVNRDKLLTFLQYRAKTFDPTLMGERLDALPPSQLQSLVDDYVREEALYREAKALQLDRNDYTLKRRLVRRVEALTDTWIDREQTLSPEALETYFKAHKDNYRVPAKVTFTHVFFSSAQHGHDKAETLARDKRQDLNRQRVPFHQSMAHSERFLYHSNYVNKELDLVSSHFGKPMQEALFALEPNDQAWQGPLQSEYGSHLVLLTHKTQAYVPALAAVQAQVMADAQRERARTQREEAIGRLVSQYSVDLSAALQTPGVL